MWPSETLIVRLGCLCVLLAALSPSVLAETTIYKQVGGVAVLAPPAVSDAITHILWLEGSNKAMEWVDGTVKGYRQFAERGDLDTSTGVMTIRGLLYNDSNTYTPEISGIRHDPVHLVVLYPVPKPNVTKSCNDSRCVLTCEGNTNRDPSVNYTWKSDDTGMHVSSEKEYVVYKSQVNSSSSHHFSCEIKNQVSHERSKPITISSKSFSWIPPSEGGPNISLGLTVLIVLLLAVMLLVAFHKLKTGTWFFEKESMPWEGDFWRRDEHQREASTANGATAKQQNEKAEEDMPMTNG